MTKTFIALPLVAGLLASSVALADPEINVTRSSSSDLGDWQLLGGQLTTQQQWRNYTPGDKSVVTESWLLAGSRRQDAQGRWWETWQVNEYQVQAYTYDVFTVTGANIQLLRPAPTVTQALQGSSSDSHWLQLDVSSNLALNYSINVNASNGSRTTPRGHEQTILPVLAISSDGGAWNNPSFNWGWAGWSGRFDSQLSVEFEATDGGKLASFWLNVYADDEQFSHVYQGQNRSLQNWWLEDRLVTAVPEPSTYALMLAGLVGIVSLQRRRRA